MARYLAFLRAINVGGRVVKMEKLRGHFAELGFAAVETFIASGNVIFETQARTASATLETKIEQHLRAALGFEVATFIRTESELAALAAARVFPVRETAAAGAALYLAFLKSAPSRSETRALISRQTAIDAFKIRGREIHWLCRARFSASEFSGAKLEKLLGCAMTVRNSTTVRRLAAKYAPAG